MARCPFAEWVPATRAGGSMAGGPPKIVHHKTITSSQNAMALYDKTGSWPHFTIGSRVQQHYDTKQSARALQNRSGGVETNRDGAIQIEVVGFCGITAPMETLANLRRLLDWLELVHGIPGLWPAGRPKQATPAGRDPGGHRRDAVLWDGSAGHYGHSQVPENTHWDPAYTDEEWHFLFGHLEVPFVNPEPVVLVPPMVPQEDDVAPQPTDRIDVAVWPDGSKVFVQRDGGVLCYGAPYYGSIPHLKPEFRQGWAEAGAISPIDAQDPTKGYVVWSAKGARYAFDADAAGFLTS